jgi:hypothetical protein
MQVGRGKFAEFKSGLPHFAIVEVEMADSTAATMVEIRCTGQGWVAQGYIEEVSAEGYNDWKQGAVAGVCFALKELPSLQKVITITKIEGLTTDTNPSIVAVASAHAVWNALGHKPSDSALTRLEGVAFTSWSRDYSYIPFAELDVSQNAT